MIFYPFIEPLMPNKMSCMQIPAPKAYRGRRRVRQSESLWSSFIRVSRGGLLLMS